MGLARAQLHETYIVAETEDGLVIVDQHAAHERLVYERIKSDLARQGVARQLLLIPERLALSAEARAALMAHASELERLGVCSEGFWRKF